MTKATYVIVSIAIIFLLLIVTSPARSEHLPETDYPMSSKFACATPQDVHEILRQNTDGEMHIAFASKIEVRRCFWSSGPVSIRILQILSKAHVKTETTDQYVSILQVEDRAHNVVYVYSSIPVDQLKKGSGI